MIQLRLIDLYQLNLEPSLQEKDLLKIEGPMSILTPEFVDRIRCSKNLLIEELMSVCEHVNVVNIDSEDNRLHIPLVASGPLEGLKIIPETIAWVNKLLLFKPLNQRWVILKEYRVQYEQGAAVAVMLGKYEANAGTFTANTWLREFLEKQKSR